MDAQRIAAEVVPTGSAHAGRVAKALAQMGLRVLHVGASISVDGTREQWEQRFGVSFVEDEKTVQEELGRRVSYLRADPASVRVPDDLEGLVADVAFVEPPQLH